MAYHEHSLINPRFEFGRNWQRFVSSLDEERVTEAERSLREMLGLETLAGKTMLDVGSGSGLFSLAAMRLGAQRVHSFDYDPQSVACTQALKRRYFPEVTNWTIDQGDVLNQDYLRSLGQWDIVYAWGVLHHTGDMWRALGDVDMLVKDNGILFISIYNDQGVRSKLWRRIKAFYNRGDWERRLVLGVFIPYFVLGHFIVDVLRGSHPLRSYADYRKRRGMARYTNWIDWLGGYPFEFAKPEDIFDFYHRRGYRLQRLVTCGGKAGCNEFVFRKDAPRPST
jgi:2-polyprenyl-6-hydroxyphenyl methylase/3-demethylubiquinone-9 3-methyltransferase